MRNEHGDGRAGFTVGFSEIADAVSHLASVWLPHPFLAAGRGERLRSHRERQERGGEQRAIHQYLRKQYAEAEGGYLKTIQISAKSTIIAQQCYPCTNNLAFFAARQKDSRCLQTLFAVPALSGCAARCPGPLRRRFHPLNSNYG
jgi:hypothetical protein